jgi:membrane protease YdiL (CAAX protease family)
MQSLLIFVPFLIPVVTAQFADRKRWAHYVTYGLLITFNLALLGITGIALLNQLAKSFMPEALDRTALEANWLGVAIACFLTSAIAFLPLITQVRRWLARWLPIEPTSVVHATALAFAVYQIGLNLGQMALIGDLEALTQTELALTIWDVLLTAIPLIIFALLGIGLFIRRDIRGAVHRLGLLPPSWRQLALAGLATALLLGFNLVLNLAWEQFDPEGYDRINRVTENLFGGLTTVAGGIVIGLAAGISEEMLFRGAVQPRLGILLTTVLFSVGHLQYGLTLAMLQVFLIGLVLAWTRKRANTTTSILIHASYNMLIVFFGLLQT